MVFADVRVDAWARYYFRWIGHSGFGNLDVRDDDRVWASSALAEINSAKIQEEMNKTKISSRLH